MKIDDMPLRLASTAKTPTGSTFRVNISAPAVHFSLSSGTPTRYVKTAESCSKRRHSFWAIAACPFYACAVDNPQSYSPRVGTITQRSPFSPQREVWPRSALGRCARRRVGEKG